MQEDVNRGRRAGREPVPYSAASAHLPLQVASTRRKDRKIHGKKEEMSRKRKKGRKKIAEANANVYIKAYRKRKETIGICIGGI